MISVSTNSDVQLSIDAGQAGNLQTADWPRTDTQVRGNVADNLALMLDSLNSLNL